MATVKRQDGIGYSASLSETKVVVTLNGQIVFTRPMPPRNFDGSPVNPGTLSGGGPWDPRTTDDYRTDYGIRVEKFKKADDIARVLLERSDGQPFSAVKNAYRVGFSSTMVAVRRNTGSQSVCDATFIGGKKVDEQCSHDVFHRKQPSN
jgi:hypothetical protein